MRVSPIYNFYEDRIKPVFRTVPGANIQKSSDLRMTPPLMCDTVSFGRVAENAEALRAMIEMDLLPDIWTGQYPISKGFLNNMLQRKVFNKPISDILKVVRTLKEKLHKVPLQIYYMLEEYAKVNPNAHLESIFQQWGPLAQLELNKIQDPIFDELKIIAKDLPQAEKEKFDTLIEKADEQRRREPILKDFSRRDFRYKLRRIAQKIHQRNIAEEVDAMDKIINMSSELPKDSPKGLFTKKKLKHKKNKMDKYNNLLNTFQQIKNFFERSVLNEDHELSTLFADVNNQIHGKKLFIPFGRYNFIESLTELTENLEDQILARRLIRKATELPTSTQEASAFIVKASRQSSDTIGYNWLLGSVGNIEHIDLHSKGGREGASNYAVSTNDANSGRGNSSIAQHMRKHPEAYFTCQFYIDKLIENSNNGILRMFGFNRRYVINFAKKLMKKSPPEKRLQLDLSALK